MAIYEYECLNCGYHFETWQKITDDPLKSCEKCGGELVRLIGNTGFVLKGTGWYVTDYVRKEKKEGKAPEKSSNSTS